MRRTLLGILSLLFSSFLFAGLASAANLAQCPAPDGSTEFVLVADDNIIFEAQQANSGRVIIGNVLVSSPHPAGGSFSNTGVGFVKVGANTTIQGTVIADVIILPDGGATITGGCVANTLIANTPAAQAICGPWPCSPAVKTCVVPGAPFTAFATAHPDCVQPPLGTQAAFSALCGPTPTVAACAETAASLTVDVGDSLTIPPAPAPFNPGDTCFGALILKKGAVLTLASAGPFTFKSVQMDAGSKLIGPAGGATVNVNGKFNTEAGVTITNIDLNVAQSTPNEVANIFNNSVLTNVNINAPFGKCHLHTGTDFCASEACCKVLDVEPIKADCTQPGQICVCPAGTKFELPPQNGQPNQSPADIRARNCVPCGAGDHPPAFPSCP